jgi:putative transposase
VNLSLFSIILRRLGSIRQAIKRSLRQLTKPDNHSLALNAVLDMTRSKPELVLENALLRQQLAVLQRQVQRPKLSWRDRALIILLASKLRSWKRALIIAQPDTVLRWHRDLFRWVWRRKSKADKKPGRPPLTDGVVTLIKQMAKGNCTWGAKRIQGELLKLGLRVSKSAIQKYIQEIRKTLPPKQNWSTFLRNHASQIWVCDFLQTYDALFRTLFVFVIIELGSRRVIRLGVTRHPTDRWIAQQLREATPFGEGPRFLIRDNDRKYGASRAPKANAIGERFLGSLRRECLDHGKKPGCPSLWLGRNGQRGFGGGSPHRLFPWKKPGPPRGGGGGRRGGGGGGPPPPTGFFLGRSPDLWSGFFTP